jgi:hypothetical protein
MYNIRLHSVIMRLKNELYDDEQSKIKKELIDILELNNKNGFILYQIDHDEELKSKIMGLLPKIRTFYSMSKITAISTPERIKRPYISIIRHILKNDYDILSAEHTLRIDEKIIRTKRYVFIKR